MILPSQILALTLLALATPLAVAVLTMTLVSLAWRCVR